MWAGNPQPGTSRWAADVFPLNSFYILLADTLFRWGLDLMLHNTGCAANVNSKVYLFAINAYPLALFV